MTATQIKTALSEIIDSLVIGNNLSDEDQREEAVETLLRMIDLYRDDL